MRSFVLVLRCLISDIYLYSPMRTTDAAEVHRLNVGPLSCISFISFRYTILS